MTTILGEIDLKLPPDIRPRFTSLDAWGQTLNTSAQTYAGEVQQAVNSILGAPEDYEAGWRMICREVLAGRVAEMHSVRDHFLRAFEDRLGLLGDARNLTRFAERVSQRQLPEAGRAEAEAKVLQSRLELLSARWRTAEDLEDLAAESIAPTSEHLEAVRRRHGFPQAWYDDDSKPF